MDQVDFVVAPVPTTELVPRSDCESTCFEAFGLTCTVPQGPLEATVVHEFFRNERKADVVDEGVVACEARFWIVHDTRVHSIVGVLLALNCTDAPAQETSMESNPSRNMSAANVYSYPATVATG